MGLFSKKNGGPASEPATEKKEIDMANLVDSLSESIDDTREAVRDFKEKLDKLVEALSVGNAIDGTKVLKRVKRSSMTLTEELVDFRKKLP